MSSIRLSAVSAALLLALSAMAVTASAEVPTSKRVVLCPTFLQFLCGSDVRTNPTPTEGQGI